MRETALKPISNSQQAYTASSGTPTNVGLAGVVRLVSTTDCYVKFASTSTSATTSDMFLPAYAPEYFSFESQTYVAAIRSSADGTLHIATMS